MKTLFFTFFLAGLSDGPLAVAADLKCEEAALWARHLLYKYHINGGESDSLRGPDRGHEFAELAAQKFLSIVDPAHLFLLEAERGELVDSAADSINKVFDEGQDPDVEICRFFAAKMEQVEAGRERHVDLMRAMTSDLGALRDEVIGRGLKPPSPEDISLMNRPARKLAELQDKAKLILIDIFRRTYASGKPYGDTEVAAFRASLRLAEELRTDYEYAEPESLPLLVAKIIFETEEPHTQYMTPRKYANYVAAMRAGEAGIPILVAAAEQGARVATLKPGTRLAREGWLRPGDIILAIDGDRDVVLSDPDRIYISLGGSPGTLVTLTVLRNGQELGLKLPREPLMDPRETVSGQMVFVGPQKLGVLAIHEFVGSSAIEVGGTAELAEFYLRWFQEQAVDGLLVDLRGNLGGVVEEVLGVLNQFLPAEAPVIGVKRRKQPNQQPTVEVVRTKPVDLSVQAPMVVLVDGETVSSAEIMAGVLKAYNRALIIGSEQTYGKGSIQTVMPFKAPIGLSGGAAITMAFTFLPSGQPLQLEGVRSDVVLPGLLPGGREKDLPHALPSPLPEPDWLEGEEVKSGRSLKWQPDSVMDCLRREIKGTAASAVGPAEVIAPVILAQWVDLVARQKSSCGGGSR